MLIVNDRVAATHRQRQVNQGFHGVQTSMVVNAWWLSRSFILRLPTVGALSLAQSYMYFLHRYPSAGATIIRNYQYPYSDFQVSPSQRTCSRQPQKKNPYILIYLYTIYIYIILCMCSVRWQFRRLFVLSKQFRTHRQKKEEIPTPCGPRSRGPSATSRATLPFHRQLGLTINGPPSDIAGEC